MIAQQEHGLSGALQALCFDVDFSDPVDVAPGIVKKATLFSSRQASGHAVQSGALVEIDDHPPLAPLERPSFADGSLTAIGQHG